MKILKSSLLSSYVYISRTKNPVYCVLPNIMYRLKSVLVDYAVDRFTETNRERHLAAYFVNIDTYRY